MFTQDILHIDKSPSTLQLLSYHKYLFLLTKETESDDFYDCISKGVFKTWHLIKYIWLFKTIFKSSSSATSSIFFMHATFHAFSIL